MIGVAGRVKTPVFKCLMQDLMCRRNRVVCTLINGKSVHRFVSGYVLHVWDKIIPEVDTGLYLFRDVKHHRYH